MKRKKRGIARLAPRGRLSRTGMYHFHSLVNLVWQPCNPQYRRLVAVNGRRFDLRASFALDFSDSTSNPTKDM
jgi:hypothetical protein